MINFIDPYLWSQLIASVIRLNGQIMKEVNIFKYLYPILCKHGGRGKGLYTLQK